MFSILLASCFQGNGDKARSEDDLWTRRVQRARMHALKKRVHPRLDEESTPHCFRAAKRHGGEQFRNLTKRPTKRHGTAIRRRSTRCSCSCSEYIILVLHRGRPRPRTKRPGITKTTYIFSTQFQTLKGKRDLRLGPASIIPSTNTMLGGAHLVYSSVPRVREGLSREDTSAREHVLLNYARVTASRETEVRGASQPENYARRLIRCAPSGPRGVKRNLNWWT